MLRQDGRISMRALAARLHISRAGDYLRVQRLENAGVITGCSAWVDPRRYGVRPVRVRALEDHRSLATNYFALKNSGRDCRQPERDDGLDLLG